MSEGCARAAAAVFRSIGIDSEVTPPSDDRTHELAARHTCGDECYPAKVTLGDFLKVLEQPGADPNKTAFLMASVQGPCRFGQYVPYMKSVFDTLGYSGVAILAPAFEDGYSEFGKACSLVVRSAWRGFVAADVLLKLVLKTRPYEVEPGSTDAVHEKCIVDLCRVLEVPYDSYAAQMEALRGSMLRARERFRRLPVRHDTARPLIGVVGEVFCRLNNFSNDDLVRRFEEAGAELWMSGFTEWFWYANSEELRSFRLHGRKFSRRAMAARIRHHFQQENEHALCSVFRDDFRGYEETEDISEVLGLAEPYLPAAGCSGEMVVNIGKCIYLAHKGLDGAIDISPFTCMNGVVCEAIYPRVSRDLAGFPIRNFYFDRTQSDLERDIGIYLELARSYRRHKPWPRR
jgi:predicted nucleotide-binding protein (sugar kinase/HSP70/actin superfamily)